jgi:hypothetical protein
MSINVCSGTGLLISYRHSIQSTCTYVLYGTIQLCKKQIVGLSFNPENMICGSCSGVQHRVLEPFGVDRKGAVGDTNPKLFVLADQAFPAGLVLGAGGGCVCVMRLECGSPNELVDLFLDLTRGCRIPAGSVIMMGSLTHLADVGLGAYAEDLSKAAAKLGRIFQGGLLPGLLFPLEPVNDPMLAKQILDAISWAKTVAKVSAGGLGILNSCLSELESRLIGSRTGTAQADFGAWYRLPKMLGSPELVKWDTRGQTGIKNSVGPLATSQVVLVLNHLMNDLSRALGLPCIDVAGLCGATESEPIGRKFVLVGASHVKRLKEVLSDMGEEFVIVETPHFRLMKTDVANLTTSIKEAIGDNREDAVLVINVLDNAFFVAMSEDGHTCPIRKDITGKYHVDGDVVCAPAETSKRLFSNLFPLLQEFKDVPKLVPTPLPRYLYSSCCDDLDHVPGLLLPGLIEGLLDNLDTLRSCGVEWHSERSCRTLRFATWPGFSVRGHIGDLTRCTPFLTVIKR